MNLALLWVDVLLIGLLWVMALSAFLGKMRWKWTRRLLCCIAVTIPLVILGCGIAAAIAVRMAVKVESLWEPYSDLLVIAYVLGSAVILWRASRRTSDGRPAASSWSGRQLLVGWCLAVGVGYMTLSNMDLALRARCAIVGTQINCMYIAMSPAIVSDSQNAATLYQEAFRRIDEDGHEGDINNPPTGNGETFDRKEPATISFLARQKATIALLREAAAMPGCRFDTDVKDLNVSSDLTGLNAVRNAANVLALDAREEIANGHPIPAIADCAALFGMSRQIGRRPLLVSALVGMGIDSLGNKTLRQTLPLVTRKEELDALHLDLLPSIGRVFQQSLLGEERFGVMSYATMPDNSPTTATSVDFTSSAMSHGAFGGALFRVFYLDLDAYLKLMNNLQNAADQPWYKVHDRLLDPDGNNHFSDLMIAILAPSLTRSFTTVGRVDAMDRCGKVAVAMTRYRIDHNGFPSQLDKLVPEYLDAVPIDPFDGKPLRLAIRNNQWIIYSVGESGIDHGGAEKMHHSEDSDILFRLDLPAARAADHPTTAP